MAEPNQLEILLEAATSGDVNILSSVIDKGFDFGNTDVNCIGLLQIAFKHGHKEFVCKLLESGLNIDTLIIDHLPRTHKWNTLCLPDVLWFKVYGESVKAHGGKQYKTMMNACLSRDYRTLVKGLQHDRSCWKPRGNGGSSYNIFYSVLLFLIMYDTSSRSALLQLLIDKGADVNATFHGFRMCDYAVLCGNANGLNLLLKNDCSVDEDGSGYFSVFRHAIVFSELECFDMLLNRCGPGSKIWNRNGLELLTLAIKYDQDRCVDILLKNGACIEVERTDQNDLKDSLLLMACENGNLANLDLLLKHGANVNDCNDMGETPLIYAAVFGFTSCLEKLISHGADLNMVDCDNQTALMHAIQRQHKDCVRTLLCAGANTSIVNSKYETALFHAISLHDKDCLELILLSEQQQSQNGSCRLINLHREAFALALRQFDVESLLMLLKYNAFSWNWFDNIKLEELRTEILARVLISANISPGHFRLSEYNKGPKTLFQCALVLQDIWTAYYLMANLYLDEYDFKYLRNEKQLIRRLHCQNKNSHHTLSLMEGLIYQPISLQVLCILNLSASVSFDCRNGNEKMRREKRISCLPIPGKFKKILNFQGPFSSICVDHWKALGTKISQHCSDNVISLSSKPIDFVVDQCRKDHCGDEDRGFRLRYELLKASNRAILHPPAVMATLIERN